MNLQQLNSMVLEREEIVEPMTNYLLQEHKKILIKRNSFIGGIFYCKLTEI
jgi:hypothetical protein